ncbi:hypothetical protein Oscil6304_1191 [Oscillatoria acuminata PCC 6304]|uniref:Uncharacterized protein n=1 Tax=Oscillatoria acuminata PCC 6304 TaxID=56110 RepID=K9TDG5_9CYAN|nr:hypothetical protein Oscil6304_1191 [Oscillatoria acuminata PCC 6304]
MEVSFSSAFKRAFKKKIKGNQDTEDIKVYNFKYHDSAGVKV